MSDISTTPLITTIIPTYRRPKMLQRAIRSVLNQTYPHFQLCVYDNASCDETASIVAEIAKTDSRVKYYCHPENIGALANFNYGMKQIDTPFFSFLSDDDIIVPEFYETALEGFKEHPEAIFSATAVINIGNNGIVFGQPTTGCKPGFYKQFDGLLAMLKNHHPTWTGILWRKEVIKIIGMLDGEVGATVDLDYELRAAAHFPFVISGKLGAIFIFHKESIWAQARFQDIWPGQLKLIRNLTEDKNIPYDVRNFAENILIKRLKKRLFFIALRYVLKKRDEDYKAIEILRDHYHLKITASLLLTITKVYNHIPIIYYFILFLNKFRKMLICKKLEPLQKRYGNLRKFLL